MLIENWMHRKSEENAHNEILAFLMAAMGLNLLVGGLLMVTVVMGEPSWLLVFPYEPLQMSSAYIGLILTFTGFIILLAGFILVVYYDRKRVWYIKQMGKSFLYEKWKTNGVVINQILEEQKEESGKKKK